MILSLKRVHLIRLLWNAQKGGRNHFNAPLKAAILYPMLSSASLAFLRPSIPVPENGI
jgi:hypothetical protein